MVQKIGVFAVISMCWVGWGSAESFVVKLPSGNAPLELSISAEQSTVTEVIAYEFSNDNDPLTGVLTVNGPAGLSARLEMQGITKSAGAEAAALATGWSPVDLSVNGKTRKVLNISASPAFVQSGIGFPGGDPCDLLSNGQYDEIRQVHRQRCPNDPVLTRPQLCAYILGGGTCLFSANPTPTPTGGTGTGGGGASGSNAATFVLLKDICNNGVKRYLVRLVMDLSAVDAATRAAGFDISVQYATQQYKGRRAASIKPTSEGKFAPQPLLLMQSISGFGAFFGSGESIELVKFKKGKVRSRAEIDIEDYVPYRDLFLTRSLIGRQLRGGKGMFVLSNGSSAYGLCLPLSRRRSYAGNY